MAKLFCAYKTIKTIVPTYFIESTAPYNVDGQHFKLLLAYCFCGQRPNVHGGYFEGALSQRLIYRLACLGYRGTLATFNGLPSLSAECEAKQIRVLLSPYL